MAMNYFEDGNFDQNDEMAGMTFNARNSPKKKERSW
jgi:hypothetical protein